MTEFVELVNAFTNQRRKVNAKNKERIEALKAVGYAEVVKEEVKKEKPKPKPKPEPEKVDKKDDNVLGS
jgi:hypothetical protein